VALSESKDEMLVNVINMGEGTSLDITLSGDWKIKSTRGIFAPSLISRNTEAEQNTVSAIKLDVKMQGNHMTVNMPKYAIAEVTLERKSRSRL
jgi:alpha-L-arabinofuranosidase